MNSVVRVLQVVTDMRRGGLESMLMNYYRHIDRTKVQFDFLTHRATRGDFDDEIEQLGGIIYHLPRLNPFSKNYHNILRNFLLQHREYKIIHVHQDCMSSVILKVAAEVGVPVRIAHSHNSNQTKNIKYPIKLFFKRDISKYATELFACSKAAGDWMFGGAIYHTLNNAIDTLRYRYDQATRDVLRKELGISPEEYVVGHVGRFSAPKNHLFLIRVFYELQKNISAKLVLIGQGTMRKEAESLVEKLGLRDKVIFTGLRTDIPQLLSTMDVFVFPSIYEGLPVTIIEAQAAGLHCLISEKVPIECAITDLVEQMFLSEGPEKWAKKILALHNLTRRDTNKEICAAGYDIMKCAGELENYYLQELKRIQVV